MKSPVTFNIDELRFLGEQDGVPEAQLKQALIALFRQDERVSKAYLARAEHGQAPAVVLALRVAPGCEKEILGTVGSVFWKMFGSEERLDIIFPSDLQEEKLAAVCLPFFATKQAGRAG
jgi:hypothetical protein